MGSPHRPSEFQELIIQEDDTICTALNNLTQLSVMVWRMVRYKYEPDQSGFTDEYADLINGVSCPDPPIAFEGEGVLPADFKNMISGLTSGFCEKFVKMAVQLSNLIYNWVAFEYNAEGELTDEYKALICGVTCEEAAEAENQFNYEDFVNWDVIASSVDLVGKDPYDPWPGNGMYVDMCGTVDGSHPDPTGGTIRQKTGVSIVSGQDYRLTVDIAGYFYTALVGKVRIRVFRSDNVTAIVDQIATRNDLDPMTSEIILFTAGVTDTCKVQLEDYDHDPAPGIANIGCKVGRVLLENVTAGSTLFDDDFDDDGGAVTVVETPDPDDMYDAIPEASRALCDKLLNLIEDFPTRLYEFVAFEYDPSGIGFTEDYATVVCRHRQGDGGEVPVPAPTGVSASDGLEDVVVVTWSPVTPASGSLSSYQIYRAPGATTDPAASVLLATVPANQVTYSDASVSPSVQYRYWVKAVQGSVASAFSNGDTGYSAAVLTPTLPAITNLKATQGFYPTTAGFIRLMFTLPAGVNKIDYRLDVYRNTTNDFPSATRVLESGRIVSYDNPDADDNGIIYDQSGTGNDLVARECIYWHEPPSGSTKYYFWVVLKLINRFNPTQVQAISEESNEALGWVQIGTGDTGAATPVTVTVDSTVIAVPLGKTKMRVLMIGAGGAGSYAEAGRRGAAGAAGDAVMVYFDVTPGDNWTWTMPQARSSTGVFVSQITANKPSSHDDYEGRASKLVGPSSKEIQAAGGLSAIYGVDIGTAAPANSGTETHISNITPIETWTERGQEGQNSGTYGGRGGAAFGFNRPGSAAASVKNAGSRDATRYSGSSGTDNATTAGQSGGNNGTPLMLYTFID